VIPKTPTTGSPPSTLRSWLTPESGTFVHLSLSLDALSSHEMHLEQFAHACVSPLSRFISVQARPGHQGGVRRSGSLVAGGRAVEGVILASSLLRPCMHTFFVLSLFLSIYPIPCYLYMPHTYSIIIVIVIPTALCVNFYPGQLRQQQNHSHNLL
jgi:hypothetical protein